MTRDSIFKTARRDRGKRGSPSSLAHPVIVTLSLNISRRARWVVYPLGRTRGHGRRIIYPLRVREERKKPRILPAAGPPVSPLHGRY